jgi:PAS domain S-box-containing protein
MTILHLEDDSADAILIREMLSAEFPGCVINQVDNRDDFLAGMAPGSEPDLILTDFSLPSMDGLTALALARERAPDIPFVFLSGSIGEDRAIDTIHAGAYDYVLKDNLARLPVVVRHALEEFERRRNAEANQRRLIELAGVIERAGEAIIVTDMSGRITLWNNGAARLYGMPASEAVGRKAEDAFPSGELARLRDAREATLAKGEWRREMGITTHDGRNIVVDIRVTLVRDVADRPMARLTIATDVTERKQLEEHFLRAQRMESLGMLAAGIAHDFNNVLAPLVMVGSLLRQHTNDPVDIGLLNTLEQSATRGTGLVRQIVGFARGTGRGIQKVQIADVLKDAGDFIRASFPKTISLKVAASPDLPTIQANPTQVHQILINLAINARDAMPPEGGKLTIGAELRILEEADTLSLKGSRPGPHVVLAVTDNGSGMTAEVLNRIWEPFYTTKGDGKGTGLGLSTVRGIATAHGGFVSVETELGRGSTFRIFLPTKGPES